MIILDLDGTLVDFCTPAYAAHGRTCSTNEPTKYDFFEEEWGMTAAEFWKPIDALGPDWWRDLPYYGWAIPLFELARGCGEFLIATTPSRNPDSTSGKVAAIQRLAGPNFRDYCITPRKWLLAAPGRVLIDDNEENCQKFEEHGGTSILFPQPWNANRNKTHDRFLHVYNEVLVFESGGGVPRRLD